MLFILKETLNAMYSRLLLFIIFAFISVCLSTAAKRRKRRSYGSEEREVAMWWWRAINRAIKCRMPPLLLLMTVAELIKLPVLQFRSLKLHFSTHKSQITARHAISHTNHFIFARRTRRTKCH